PVRTGKCRVAPGHALLDDDGATHRFDGTAELGEEAVTHPFDYAAVVFGDGWLDQLAAMALDARDRPFFVHADEPTVAGNIRRDDRDQPTRAFCVRLPAHHAPHQR